MTPDEIIDKLDAMTGGDPEADHGDADQLLLEALRFAGQAAVADAYERLTVRCPWWAYA